MAKPVKIKPKIFKCIAEAIEQVALQCPNGDDITYGRPTLTVMCLFIDQEIYRKRIRVLASGLPEKANNEEWQAHRKSCGTDLKLAVDSFCALYGLNKDGESIQTELMKVE